MQNAEYEAQIAKLKQQNQALTLENEQLRAKKENTPQMLEDQLQQLESTRGEPNRESVMVRAFLRAAAAFRTYGCTHDRVRQAHIAAAEASIGSLIIKSETLKQRIKDVEASKEKAGWGGSNLPELKRQQKAAEEDFQASLDIYMDLRPHGMALIAGDVTTDTAAYNDKFASIDGKEIEQVEQLMCVPTREPALAPPQAKKSRLLRSAAPRRSNVDSTIELRQTISHGDNLQVTDTRFLTYLAKDAAAADPLVETLTAKLVKSTQGAAFVSNNKVAIKTFERSRTKSMRDYRGQMDRLCDMVSFFFFVKSKAATRSSH